MLIRKISLKNFRNFKNCRLEFSTDPNKNFTIILGQNTFGKTTLVKSFIWCLYRENLFDDKILLNTDIAESLPISHVESAVVELELEHKNTLYKITTTEKYTKNNLGNISVCFKAYTKIITVDNDGNAMPISNESSVREEIESILKPELKEYFFFDGETNSIETISSKKNLTNAVTNILGLNKIEMIKDYYDPFKNESVPSYLRKELVIVDDKLLDNLNEEIEKEQGRKESLLQEKEEIEKEIEKLNNQKNSLEEILDSNQDIAEKQDSKRRIEKELCSERAKRETDFDNLIKSFSSSNSLLKILYAKSFVKYNFKDLSLDSTFNTANSYKGINEDAVNDLISRGYCLCGAEIKTGNDAYNHLIEAKQHMEPRDYGKYLADFVDNETSNLSLSSTRLNDIVDMAGRENDLIYKIDENVDSLKELKNQLQGRTDVGEIQKQITNIDYQLGSKEGRLKYINETELPRIENNIQAKSDKLNKSTCKTDANDFIKKCIAYSESIYNLASNVIKKRKAEIKIKLQQEVGEIFSSMYTGNRKIIIDDNYKASTVVTQSGSDKKIDGSTGLGTVVNYSFVAGLMNLAKQSIENKSQDDLQDEDSTVESYPLVMDAPFSNTDEEHIKNICNVLPNYCDQIIMFVMQKDFMYAGDTIMQKIGKKYKLIKVSETEAKAEEEY